MNYFEIYKNQVIYQFIHMTIAWILCIVNNNGSMVDFGWPSGFFVMTIYFFFTGNASTVKKLIICGPLFLAGLRFMVGWLFGRKHYKKEDKRWELWRERWRNGEGWFSIKSIPINFFFFYHAQSMTNAFAFSLPLILITNSTTEINCYEIAGLIIWIISFVFENIADVQLGNFKIKNKNKRESTVCRDGLWAYSRHPNYFFEFLLWIGIFIMTYPHLTESWQYVFWLCIPLGGYFYLVEFTGIPMCEKQSLKTRGDIYRQYQEEVNLFFPWFPKVKSN